MGSVARVESRGGKHFTISCREIPHQLKEGDSVAVNGACQTATIINEASFSFFSSTETLSLTNLDHLKPGDFVNLERPLSLTTLLDGHMVQGHVDGTGIIHSLQKKQEEYIIRITCSHELLRYMIKKGSVAVDGVSLTINELYEDGILLTLIPLSFEKTIFQYRSPGDRVNIETDIIAKYIERFHTYTPATSRLTEDFLKDHGFH